MKFNPDLHHRRTIRLRHYNYNQAGFYFVTVCVRNRECLFGDVVGNAIQLNRVGEFVSQTWLDLSGRFKSIRSDAFVVMPNHFHGVIILVGAGLALPSTRVHMAKDFSAPPRIRPETGKRGAASSAPTLGDIIRVFKSLSAIGVNRLSGRSGQPLWQRNYYEHIIRDDEELDRIRQYIADNPSNWAEDSENPLSVQAQKRSGPVNRTSKISSLLEDRLD